MAADLARLTWHDHLNVYLLATPQGPVLVDSAAPGMFTWLVQALRSEGLRPEDLAGVVVTHFHLDHVGTAHALAKRGVPTWALAEDAAILAGAAPHPGYGGRAGRALLGLERLLFGAPSLPGVQPLEAGEALFETAWRVLAAPGHTPGSLALFNEETGDLVSGDTLVSDFNWPRGPHPLFTADYDRAARSALELLDLGPKRILPGHGRPRPCGDFDGVRATLTRRLHRRAGDDERGPARPSAGRRALT